MPQSSDGQKKKEAGLSTTLTPFKPFADLRSQCPSCGGKSGVLLAWASSVPSESGSSPFPPADKPESSPTASDSSSPSQQHSLENGAGPLQDSAGFGLSTSPYMKKVETLNLASPGKPRCNMCSRLFTTRNSTKGDCSCGCRAWFFSRITLVERLGFLVGYHKDADASMLQQIDAPLGGDARTFSDKWAAAQEVNSNGNSST